MKTYPTQLSKEVHVSPAPVVHDLFIAKGLSIDLAEQLVEASRQPHIREYCPNDAAKRFNCLESVIAWQSKGRLALPLVKKIGDGALELAGFGWMGPGKPADDEPEIRGVTTTFAIRLYENALGRGCALPYTKAILETHGEMHGNTGVWLEAWGDNLAALKTYEKVGFNKVAEVPSVRHDEPCSRIYMTLGKMTL